MEIILSSLPTWAFGDMALFFFFFSGEDIYLFACLAKNM